MGFEAAKDFLCTCIGIVDDRAAATRRLIMGRNHRIAELDDRAVVRPTNFVGFGLGFLAETRVEEIHDVHVQPVEPDHRFAPYVGVIVPHPGRRDHEVAGQHHRPLTIDGSVGILAFDDEAQC